MNKSPNAPAATVDAVASQFQVSELEPRLENVWGIADGPEQPNPTPQVE